MRSYRRVTYKDRCQIQAYLQAKQPISWICIQLGFHRSTVYREIKRHTKRGYDAQDAQQQAQKNVARCKRPYVIDQNLENILHHHFSQHQWSPEQIYLRYRLEGQSMPSTSTIYRWIKRRRPLRRKRYLRRYNRRGTSRYAQAKVPCSRLSIHQRPEQAKQRLRIGDWERDTLYIKQRKQILVCTDRASRYTTMQMLSRTDNQSVARVTQKLLQSPLHKPVTITNDNGPEFRRPIDIGVPVFYCDARKPQQRGTVENTIGLIRQYIPRSTQPKDLSHRKIKQIQKTLNLRPRKCLDFRTPFEIFRNQSVALTMKI